jgi:hypothetical protein
MRFLPHLHVVVLMWRVQQGRQAAPGLQPRHELGYAHVHNLAGSSSRAYADIPAETQLVGFPHPQLGWEKQQLTPIPIN